jgi:hypothetical protein
MIAPPWSLSNRKITPNDRDTFLALLKTFSKERLRDGARLSDISLSVETPDLWIESFHPRGWFEHLAHPQRVAKSDRDVQEQIKALDLHRDGPLMRRYLKPEQQAQH